jgi:hypothetical protein
MDKEKQQLWTNRLQDLQNSGLRGTEWCRKNGIPEHQLWYWKKKLTQTIAEKQPANENSANWIALDITQDEPNHKNTITIRLGAVKIEVGPGYNANLLQDVVCTLVNL